MYESMRVSMYEWYIYFPQALIVGDFAVENPFSWDVVRL